MTLTQLFQTLLNLFHPAATPPPPKLPLKAIPSSLPWQAKVDGDDIVVENVKCTFFGGNHDPMDSGRTSSGINTRDNPLVLGCALPVVERIDGVLFALTCNSPLAYTPQIPWQTEVVVTSVIGESVRVKLIDNGPNVRDYPYNAIDLTIAAYAAIGGSKTLGHTIVNYRIIGGARFIPQALLALM